MEITITIPQVVNVKILHVKAFVRYWEDTMVNGEYDTENGDNIPCKQGYCWCPVVDIDSGIITNWEKGKTASIHYKVCDKCSFYVFDGNGKEFYKEENEYVPRILCPKENGYGDYIIMDIDESGKIDNWNTRDVANLFEMLD